MHILSDAIWFFPLGVLMLVGMFVSLSLYRKSSQTMKCPECGVRFYSNMVVDGVVMLPCGHKFKRVAVTTENTGAR